ncbi:MAG: ribosome biogenesis GTPase Der [Pacificimonas sp.]
MSDAPRVVIVGRPNVGKSTLFNRLVGKRIAIVDDTPGVTRDRREGAAELGDLAFVAVDTAGFEDSDEDSLSGRMRQQTLAALDGAAAAMFVIDARAGVTPLDRQFAEVLRAAPVPLILVANKAEANAATSQVYEAYELGMGDPIAVSAEHGEGMGELFEALSPHVDAHMAEAFGEEEDDEEEGPLRLAIVGRPNAGKSTLINKMLSEERLVTGPEAGITRDSIEIEWRWEGRDVRLIDTAGVRKRAKVHEKLEKLSVADTRRAIDFAEVVVLLLDATLGLEAQDLKIADQVLQEGRALIIALSKWDSAKEQSSLFNGVKAALADGLSQISGVPLLTVSGLTGKGIDTLIEVAFEQRASWSRRVSTGALNRWFEDAKEKNPPPAPKGKRIKLRYITQAKTRPPSFVVFGNRLDMLPGSYERYLLNSLRTAFDLEGVPLRLNMRSKANPYAKD